MKKKSKLFLLVVILCCLGLYLFLRNDNLKTDTSSQKVTITQYGQGKIFLYLPLYIAMEEGYFVEQGLDVSLTFSGNDDQIAATVTGGHADFGVGDPIFSAIIQEKGGQLKTIATLVEKAPFIGYTNKDGISEIKNLKNLNGLKVSSFPSPSTLYTNLTNLKNSNHLDMVVNPVAFGSQMAALEAGEVDIAMDLDPNVAVAEAQGYKAVISLGNFLPPQAITGITAREDFIKEHPEIVQKVLNALQKAVTAFYKDKNIGIRVAQKVFSEIDSQSIVRAVNRSHQNAIYPKAVTIKDNIWQQGILERLNAGDLKNPQTTDTATDNTFAEKAFEEYGK